MDAPLAPLAEAAWTTTLDRRALAGGLAVVTLLAVAKLALHLATTGLFGYSYFVDELYFLACAEHLAWGYVDMPPLFPAVTALIRAGFGDSLLAVRLLPALPGAALVLMTGWMARRSWWSAARAGRCCSPSNASSASRRRATTCASTSAKAAA